MNVYTKIHFKARQSQCVNTCDPNTLKYKRAKRTKYFAVTDHGKMI